MVPTVGHLFHKIYYTIVVIEGNTKIVQHIYEELVANRLMNQRLWNMMNSLKDDIKKLTIANVSTLGMSNEFEDKIFLEKFPFSKKEDILEFEKLLQIDNNDREKLVYFFNLIFYLILKL